MGILKKITDLLSGKSNNMAGMPEEAQNALVQFIKGLEEELKNTKDNADMCIAEKKALERKYNMISAKTEELEKQAEKAVIEDNDILAKEVLKKFFKYKRNRDAYKLELEDKEAEEENMNSQVLNLDQKINDTRARMELLIFTPRNSKGKKTSYISEEDSSVRITEDTSLNTQNTSENSALKNNMSEDEENIDFDAEVEKDDGVVEDEVIEQELLKLKIKFEKQI